jgi:N4-(beta-N-acetylglucosaminyl)-L-asparaginase
MTEKRLLTADGKPRYQLNFYAINKRGEYGAASLYPSRFAIHDGTEARRQDTAHLYDTAAPND